MAEEAKKKRTAAKSQFTRAESSLKTALSMDSCATWTLENRYAELRRRWDNVQEAHDSYIPFIEEGTAETETDDIWISELADRFDKIELQLGCRMNTSPVKTEVKLPVTETDKHQSTKSRKIVKIESIKFQTFTGDIRKYPVFKYEFKAHIAPLCERDQEVLVLKSYLSEEIKEEIMNAGDNSTDIWLRLDSKYGRVDRIVENVLTDVKALSKSEDSGDILDMISIIEKAHRDLKNLLKEEEMQNSSVISDIEGAMSSQMRYEWIKLIANESLDSKAKFHKLLKFLQEWRNRLGYDGASIRSGAGMWKRKR